MRTLPTGTSLGLGALLLVAAVPQQSLPVPIRSSTNILGNGGVESWNRGSGFQGPIGPDLWYAMGDTSDVFTQGDIAFTRTTGCPPGGTGSTVMQIRANLPQNYVSQSAENFAEYAGKDVTFSVSIHPLFPLASAHIAIDDGIGSSSAPITVTMGQWGRVTVRHTVASCPTKLEFRIYPEQTVDVDEAMAVVGRQPSADFVPRPNPEPGLEEVPLGSVLDWYRFDASVPVPEGFAICDGSLVANVSSPFLGRATPNLTDRFVRGVTNVANIGTSGGSSTHAHSGTTGENEGGPGNPPGDWWFIELQCCDVMRCARDGHRHDFTTNVASSLPPYVGLLKIIRVK
jgi:hypothetical protein